MSFLGLLLAFAVAAFIWWISWKGLSANARSSTSAAYVRRGLGLYVSGKDQDSAIAAFTESLMLNPKNAAALIGRGGAYLERKDYADAVADLTAAIQLKPDTTQGCLAYFTRATAYLRWGDYEKAIADATAAIGLNPNFADAYFTRSSAYLKRYGLPPNPAPVAKRRSGRRYDRCRPCRGGSSCINRPRGSRSRERNPFPHPRCLKRRFAMSRPDDLWNDFWSFRLMITPIIMRVAFAIGVPDRCSRNDHIRVRPARRTWLRIAGPNCRRATPLPHHGAHLANRLRTGDGGLQH